MRAAVRSVSARSVSVRRAGSALTIGAATSELSQIIALLRSVGGSLYLPGQTNRVAADGSGASVLDGDVVGYVPDLVGSGNALTQATTANKPLIKRVPILGPELVVNGSGDNTAGWLCPDATVATVGGEFVLTAVKTAYPAMFRAFPTVVGKKYLVSGDMRNGTATTSIAVYPIPQQGEVYTSTATSTMTTRTCEFVATGTTTQVAASMRTTSAVVGSTAIFDNISVREILGYRDVWTLNFDGVNDVLSSSAVSQWADDLIVMAVSSATSFAVPCDVLRSVTATTGIIRCFFSSIGVQISRTNSNGVSVSSFYSTSTAPGVARVFEFDSIALKQRAGADGAFAAWSAAADSTLAPTFTTSYLGGAAGSSSAINQGPVIILPGAAATNCTAAQRTILRNWLAKYRDWMNA